MSTVRLTCREGQVEEMLSTGESTEQERMCPTSSEVAMNGTEFPALDTFKSPRLELLSPDVLWT